MLFCEGDRIQRARPARAAWPASAAASRRRRIAAIARLVAPTTSAPSFGRTSLKDIVRAETERVERELNPCLEETGERRGGKRLQISQVAEVKMKELGWSRRGEE